MVITITPIDTLIVLLFCISVQPNARQAKDRIGLAIAVHSLCLRSGELNEKSNSRYSCGYISIGTVEQSKIPTLFEK